MMDELIYNLQQGGKVSKDDEIKKKKNPEGEDDDVSESGESGGKVEDQDRNDIFNRDEDDDVFGDD